MIQRIKNSPLLISIILALLVTILMSCGEPSIKGVYMCKSEVNSNGVVRFMDVWSFYDGAGYKNTFHRHTHFKHTDGSTSEHYDLFRLSHEGDSVYIKQQEGDWSEAMSFSFYGNRFYVDGFLYERLDSDFEFPK